MNFELETLVFHLLLYIPAATILCSSHLNFFSLYCRVGREMGRSYYTIIFPYLASSLSGVLRQFIASWSRKYLRRPSHHWDGPLGCCCWPALLRKQTDPSMTRASAAAWPISFFDCQEVEWNTASGEMDSRYFFTSLGCWSLLMQNFSGPRRNCRRPGIYHTGIVK